MGPNPMMLTWQDIRDATRSDDTIQQVFSLLRTGTPSDGRSLPPDLRPYLPLFPSLYELDGVLMLTERIVIPSSLRQSFLGILHAVHQSIDRMKARTTDTVYWPGLMDLSLQQKPPSCS